MDRDHGRLVVLEGIDGSGKSTQFRLLCRRMEAEGRPFRRLVFPQYSEPSSSLLRMYLNGEFGDRPEDVSAYAASTFYAVDRYASYVKVWREGYLTGETILADRYTTSNAIHQASKLSANEREAFFRWLSGFEYGLMELPEPDLVLYMDVPLETAVANMRTREAGAGHAGDIHETDTDYLAKCLDSAEAAASYYGWEKIRCTEGGDMRDPAAIHEEIYSLIFSGEGIIGD